ncbi:hypothetical protein BC834DRAFT_471649 [Gloeopeniophorella convolvens]|nr:hypothetical protein BC834DRAFT_471649 [Gloeopeniophorella convolvens]
MDSKVLLASHKRRVTGSSSACCYRVISNHTVDSRHSSTVRSRPRCLLCQSRPSRGSCCPPGSTRPHCCPRDPAPAPRVACARHLYQRRAGCAASSSTACCTSGALRYRRRARPLAAGGMCASPSCGRVTAGASSRGHSWKRTGENLFVHALREDHWLRAYTQRGNLRRDVCGRGSP